MTAMTPREQPKVTEPPRAEDQERPRGRYAVWGREIPFRNPNFTGREKELDELRSQLVEKTTAVIGQPVLPLYGLGGVGKTEMAAEYAHRWRSSYSLCWWVRCEREALIVNSLLSLGRMLQLPDFRVEDRDYSVSLVIDALNRGEPYQDWLLIFDNAINSEMVSNYIPQGTGHVIITSRDSYWRRALRVEGIELAEFQTAETVEFLRKRVPALGIIEYMPDTDGMDEAQVREENERRRSDAAELATELANLPLAAEHAGAYLAETGTSAQEYLTLFRSNAHKLLATDVDIAYPPPVATTWSVSRSTISAEADALFKLLAFFAPEPISEELLLQPAEAGALPDPLSQVLAGTTQFRRAARQLARFSLARINPVRNVIQVHRVVQAVTLGQLLREDPEEAEEYRLIAHRLLAASDPNAPDRDDSEEVYERSRQHLVPSGALESENEFVRRLVINQVRRLHRRGGYSESLSLGEPALRIWRERFGPNDRRTLALAAEIGTALRRIGRVDEALELNADTLARVRKEFGEEDQIYLTCAASYSIDLSMLGRYAEALENDLQLLPLYESVFGPEHLDALRVRNNIAISLRCLGRFEEALRYDRKTLDDRERILGPSDTDTLSSQFAIARDLRRMGRYEEALDTIRTVNDALVQKGEPWNHFRLIVAADLGVALRRAGYYADASEIGEEVLERCIVVRGAEHRETLRAATNVINDRRLVNNLVRAQELGEQNLVAWQRVGGAEHPNAIAARVNLAVVLRLRGNPSSAMEHDEHALAEFSRMFGDEHPSAIMVMANLASDLAAIGEARRAREIGEQALLLAREVRGPRHPVTLAIASNLAFDRRADGDAKGARELHDEAVAEFIEALGPEHPYTRLAAQSGRINLDIEPMMN
jgi:tetratricopeptide (TPR) repeat protein